MEDGKVEKDKEREDTNAQGRRKGQRRKVDKGKEEKNGMFQLSVFPEG